MKDDERAKTKPLHSTFRHQLKVSKLHRITNDDMEELDRFRSRVFALGDEHQKLWREYNIYGVTSYTDPKIGQRYGAVAANDVFNLYNQWLNLRMEMEQFLESKNLPLNYEERVWSRPYVTTNSGKMCYDGSYLPTGFDSGPAKWCEITLDGMTSEMHSRRHIQRIESYSIAGFITGIVGIVLSLTTLFC